MKAILVVIVFVMLCSGCGRIDSPVQPVPAANHTVRWVEVKNGGTPASSIKVSSPRFAPYATTTIQFDLPGDAIVSLTIYDAGGIITAKLLNRVQLDAGAQEVEFDASNLASGIYVFTVVAQTLTADLELSSNVYIQSRKFELIK
jgi:uncharacterized protein YceK